MPSQISRLLALLLIQATACTLQCFAAQRTVPGFDPALVVLDAGEMMDGASTVAEMGRAAEKLDDYALVFETVTFKKNKDTIAEKGRLFFKKPKLMRLEEIGDYQKGSIVVIGKDGKARARGGGLARFITLTMEPDDKQLNAANGDRMINSDFISLAAGLQKRLQMGQKTRVSKAPITAGGVSRPALLLELYKPADPKNVLKRLWVDPKTYLPIRWDDFDYAMPCSSTWTEIKANPGLGDEVFRL